MSYIVTAYYTKNTSYENHVKRLEDSLIKFGIPYDIVPIINQGNWNKNTHYKPKFLLDMMVKYPDKDIVYVDVDAEFMAYPELFDTLSKSCTTIAAHYLDHTKHKKVRRPSELLSGTLYIANTKQMKELIYKWYSRCNEDMIMWDQRILYKLVGESAIPLPEEYCCIFDYPYNRKVNPVIIHYQASRKAKQMERKTR